MEINFFTIWFLVSPFIILHLYLKNKEYKEKANQVVQQINDVWDKDYKSIITSYGTLKNFLDCHEQDYKIIRDNIVKFYSAVSDANRRYMTKTETLLKMIEDGKIRKDEIYKAIKMIRREACIQVDDMLTQMNAFIVDEEQAHSNNKEMVDVLNDIDDKYKNNSIYKEVNKD